MATIHHLPGGPSGLPLNLIAQAIPKLTRHELAALTERLIDALDIQDGDPDEEDEDPAEDDDPAGQSDEDGCNIPACMRVAGPGCDISDPGGEGGGEPDYPACYPRYGIDWSKEPINH